MAKQEELRPLRVGAAHAQGPAVTITRRAAERLREGSVWVYRSEVEQVLPAVGAAGIEPGADADDLGHARSAGPRQHLVPVRIVIGVIEVGVGIDQHADFSPGEAVGTLKDGPRRGPRRDRPPRPNPSRWRRWRA